MADDHQLDHLVAAVQEHASTSHGHQVTRDRVLAELGTGWESARNIAPAGGDEDAIQRVVGDYGDRLRTGDVAGIGGLYTRDATVMAPDQAAASGSDQITDLYTTALAVCRMDYTFEFDEVQVRGTNAIARTRTAGVTTVGGSGE